MKRPREPEQYVNENTDQLVRVIKHSSNSFPRALALAALVEYGDDAAVESVAEELEQFVKRREGR